MSQVPPRDPKGNRTGFTTGACSAAAAKAAARVLVQDVTLEEIETVLPNRQRVRFALERCEQHGDHAICSVRKDAGDDPDCTHGAELVAEVRLRRGSGVRLRGGTGIATVTKPGLGLEVGGPAINPVPRRNITEMVLEELGGCGAFAGADVTLHVPGGVEMAKETLNGRLGLLGGISILGTTGIVRPYSTAAFRASVVQAVDVAHERGYADVALTTGGKSEQYAMRLLPWLPDDAFVQMGDFFGVAVRRCAKRRFARTHVVGMIGKISKMADGKKMTHAAGSQVNMALLAELAQEAGADAATRDAIMDAATARRVLELCEAKGLMGIAERLCARVVHHAEQHADGPLNAVAYLVGFDGRLLGRFPPGGDTSVAREA